MALSVDLLTKLALGSSELSVMTRGTESIHHRSMAEDFSGLAEVLGYSLPFSAIDYGARGDGVTDCTAAIQAAIDAAYAVGGGRAVVSIPGEYVCGNIILRAGVTLEGPESGSFQAMGARTTIKLKNGANCDLISIPSGTIKASLKNLRLDGNKANQSAASSGVAYANCLALYPGGYDLLARIHGCVIENFYTDGIYLGRGPRALSIIDSFVRACGRTGIQLRSSDVKIIGSGVGECATASIELLSAACRVIGCDIWGSGVGIIVDANTYDGVSAQWTTNNGIVSCHINDNLGAGIVLKGNACVINACEFNKNSQAIDGGAPSIDVHDSTQAANVITNNVFSFDGPSTPAKRPNYHIYFQAGSSLVAGGGNQYRTGSVTVAFTNDATRMTNGEPVALSGTSVSVTGNVAAGGNVTAGGALVGGSVSVTGGVTAAGVVHTLGSNTGGYTVLTLNRAAGSAAGLRFRTAGVDRWITQVSDTAEGGGDAGSDWEVYRYSDAGVYIDTPLKITRSNGLVALGPAGAYRFSAADFIALTALGLGTSSKPWGATFLGATMVSSLSSTGDATFGSDAGTYRVVSLNRAAGSAAGLRFRTAGVDRWIAQVNNAAEGGADAGSDYEIYRYSDAGLYLGTPLKIWRSNGLVTLAGAGLAVGTGFGCNGQSAQVAYAVGDAATDLATVIALANNLRTMALNNGMAKVS